MPLLRQALDCPPVNKRIAKFVGWSGGASHHDFWHKGGLRVISVIEAQADILASARREAS
jgi:hypothetical protein